MAHVQGYRTTLTKEESDRLAQVAEGMKIAIGKSTGQAPRSGVIGADEGRLLHTARRTVSAGPSDARRQLVTLEVCWCNFRRHRRTGFKETN